MQDKKAVNRINEDEAPIQLYSREAEENLIGSVLVYPENFSEVSLILQDGMNEFWLHRNQWIWNAIETLRAKMQPVDFVTVCDTLERQGFIAEVTPAYITSCMSNHLSYNSAGYAEIVHDFYVRRSMRYAAENILKLAYKFESSLDEIQSEATQEVNAVGILGQSRNMTTFDDALTTVHNRTIERSNLTELPGLRTGLPDLDTMLGGGWQNGRFYQIAMRPGGGKTSFMTQTMVHAAKHRKSGLFFSMEMAQEDIVQRMVSQELLISGEGLNTGRLSENEWGLFAHVPTMRSLQIIVDDTSSLTPEQMMSKCEIVKNLYGLDFICVDYLALMQATSDRKFSNRVQEIDYFARSLKVMARTFNVPVLAANQMNRNIEHRAANAPPVLADLNEGGEKDADVVIFIHHNKEGDVIQSSSLNTAKNRFGQTGTIPVVFRGEFTRFESAAHFSQR